ncbi:extracellular calcium-sensing receptor-like [Stegostoma tigrinum]|uniref:extracellular calcium-sensing receptor-like n=1 Tax=Stegostoma tigrinum TaxID=3053191 RepID=UPI00202B86B7|nr:extracellular calcium-sensing receptor-like [Stegostoma tigrinum]
MCKLLGEFYLPGLYEDGDIIIGGIFPIYNKELEINNSFTTQPPSSECASFDLRAFRWTQVMIFAINEINQDSRILPNVTLGYRIHDSCASPSQALKAALALINGQEKNIPELNCKEGSPIPAIIGESGSSQSIAIARAVTSFGISMVSYFSTCACLSNKREFPTFFRTVPSDLFQAKALAQFVEHFGWTWIGTIGGDNEYGRYGIQAFSELVQRSGICIAFSETILRTYSKERILKIVDTIKMSTAKVILAFASEGDLYPLLNEVVRQNITGIQWIASEAWITAARPSTRDNFKSLGGTIGFASRKMAIPKLKNFLMSLRPSIHSTFDFVNVFWETIFGCTFNNDSSVFTKRCTGRENLQKVNNSFFDVTQLRVSYNVYKAVYAIAHALHSLLFCREGICQFGEDGQPQRLFQHLKEVRFTNRIDEHIYFDSNGDPTASYDIINWQMKQNGSVEHVTVGYFDVSAPAGKMFMIKEDSIIWHGNKRKVPQSVCSESCPPGSRKAVQNGQHTCCFDCLPCSEGEVTNTTDSLECMKCPLEYWSSKDSQSCILKELEFLSFADTMGIILMTVALFGACITLIIASTFLYHKDTPIVKANNSELSFLLLFSLVLCFLCSLTFIGKPSVWSCVLRHTVFGITFVLCISCILGKTIVVLIAFKATVPQMNVLKWFGPVQQKAIVCACTFIQIVICITWLIVAPPFPTNYAKYHNSKVILECNVGSPVAFYCVLGYIGILACLCFVLAFLARKLPGNFNEAKLITFSMLIFCAVWLTFIPAYVSSPGKYTVAVEIFAILSSSFGLLFCIFGPKCYIILFKPEKNTKRNLMRKMPSKKI